MKDKPKLYVIRKYIKATSAAQAIRKDKATAVHDVFCEEVWRDRNLADAIGFSVEQPEADDD